MDNMAVARSDGVGEDRIYEVAQMQPLYPGCIVSSFYPGNVLSRTHSHGSV